MVPNGVSISGCFTCFRIFSVIFCCTTATSSGRLLTSYNLLLSPLLPTKGMFNVPPLTWPRLTCHANALPFPPLTVPAPSLYYCALSPPFLGMANWTARRLGTRPLKNERQYMKTYRILILSNDSIRSESDQIESSLRFVLGTKNIQNTTILACRCRIRI